MPDHPCIVRQGESGEGGPGIVRRVNGKLTCVPIKMSKRTDAAPTGIAEVDAAIAAADAIEDPKERAYRLYQIETENAWRGGSR